MTKISYKENTELSFVSCSKVSATITSPALEWLILSLRAGMLEWSKKVKVGVRRGCKGEEWSGISSSYPLPSPIFQQNSPPLHFILTLFLAPGPEKIFIKTEWILEYLSPPVSAAWKEVTFLWSGTWHRVTVLCLSLLWHLVGEDREVGIQETLSFIIFSHPLILSQCLHLSSYLVILHHAALDLGLWIQLHSSLAFLIWR